MNVPPLPRDPAGTRRFFDAYTQGLTTAELERLFTRDAPEAYRFFSRTIDFEELSKLPWHRRTLAHLRLFFLAFTLKLTPARRALYGMALVAALIGVLELLQDVHFLLVPHVRAGHALAAHRIRAGQPDRAARGRRSPVAQERSRDRARDPAGDAADGSLPRAGDRSVRHDAPGQHRRRRLLRRHPAGRRPRAARARRRRRQGQSGGAADGAAAGDDADARRRRARGRRADDAPERPGREARAGVALRHAVHRHPQPVYGRARLRQRRPEPAAAATRLRRATSVCARAASRSACSSTRRTCRHGRCWTPATCS